VCLPVRSSASIANENEPIAESNGHGYHRRRLVMNDAFVLAITSFPPNPSRISTDGKSLCRIVQHARNDPAAAAANSFDGHLSHGARPQQVLVSGVIISSVRTR